jgi:hypothetical protein
MDLSVRPTGASRTKVTLKERIKDRKPPPIKLITNLAKNDTLTTPDINKAIQTPDLRKILLQNQQDLGSSLPVGPLGDIGGNIKEEIESNPPSVDASVSSDKAEEISAEPIRGMNDQDQEINTMTLTSGINGQEITRPMGLPTVPIDMSAQEREKVDRKRQRNRVAATKCRKRKIERITVLEQEVKELNESLQSKMKEKRELEIEVEEIRNRIKIHIKQGCTGLEEYLID